MPSTDLDASDLTALIRLNELRAAGAADESAQELAALEAGFDVAYGAGLRLAVYGTLAPGEPNHHHLSDLAGQWRGGGSVTGTLEALGWGADMGFPALRWSADGDAVAVQLLVSEELPAHWPRLDEFEGGQYLRILVPVRFAGGGVEIANLYAAHPSL